MLYPFHYCNRRGIPKIDVQSVSVSETSVSFVLPCNAFRMLEENGLVLIRIGVEIPEGTTGTLPVEFVSNDAPQALSDVGGTAITAADLPSTGVYLFYYDKSGNVMQLLSRTV